MEQQAYEQLERVLWADTAFLASMGVMDYSLLVGVDRNNHTLVIGIIDFIRQVSPYCIYPDPLSWPGHTCFDVREQLPCRRGWQA